MSGCVQLELNSINYYSFNILTLSEMLENKPIN